MKRILILVLALFLIPIVSAVGSNTTLGFAGSILDITTGNYTRGATNITLNISESDSCTANVIYSEKFSNNVSDGVFSLLAGYYKEHLNLQYGRDYWSCYEITNGTFTERFGADPFTAGKGIIAGEDLNISTTYNATSIVVESGTLDDGNLASIQIPEDDNSYNVSEAAGADPLIININFTNVPDFDNVIGRIWYEGGQGHEMQIEIWRVDTEVWENQEEYTDMTDFVNIHFPVFDPANHIGVNGNVSIRFNHDQNGVPNHDFRIDYLAIVDGWTALTTGNEHDATSGRDNKENHPWAFPTDASRNITGSLNYSGPNPFILNCGNSAGDYCDIRANTVDTNSRFTMVGGGGVTFISNNNFGVRLGTGATNSFRVMTSGGATQGSIDNRGNMALQGNLTLGGFGATLFADMTRDVVRIGGLNVTGNTTLRGNLNVNLTTNTTTLVVNSLANCDTVNTTANGTFICGTDNVKQTKEVFIPVHMGVGTGTPTVVGDFAVMTLGVETGETAHMTFMIPADFNRFTNLEVVIRVTGTQSDYTIDTDFGTYREVFTTHSTTVTSTANNLGPGLITAIAITDTNMAAGDFVGVKVTEAGTVVGGDSDIDVLGVRLKY